MRRVVGWLMLLVCLGLAAFAVVYVAARFNDGPLGPIPGGPFRATAAAGLPDAAQAGAANTVEIEVGQPEPRSRTTWIIEHDGVLYVPAGFAARKQWPAQAEADGRLRLRVGGKVYAAKATRVTDPALRTALLEKVAKKYDVKGDPQGAMAQSTWFFRLDPLGSSSLLRSALVVAACCGDGGSQRYSSTASRSSRQAASSSRTIASRSAGEV